MPLARGFIGCGSGGRLIQEQGRTVESLYGLDVIRVSAERAVRQLTHLSGKVCLVAGGSGDLGSAAALGLAAAGADVVVSSRRLERCEAIAEVVRQLGRRGLACRLDVTSLTSIDTLFERVVTEFGRVDVLVNCMGSNVRKPAEEISEEDWDQVYDTNLKGAFFCAQHAFRVMQPRGSGRIINVASAAGQVARPWPTTSIYGSSKAGLLHLTRYLAAEWAPHGITVNAIAPGYFKTALTESLWSQPAVLERVLQLTPFGRMGEPEEFIGPLLLLASDASSYMTGHALFVDGGRVVL